MNRHLKRVIESLMGPTGSILLHALIVAALVKLVFFETPSQEPEVEVVMMEIEEADLEEVKRELEVMEDLNVVQAIAPPEVSLDQVPPEEVEEFEAAEPEVDFAVLEMVDAVQSPLIIRGMYAGRSDAGRVSGLRRAGRWAEYTEAAVLRALEWLKANQNPDGSWDSRHQTAMTGLGLLTFLAHGETPASERYGPTVEKAIRFLVDSQREDGTWPNSGPTAPYGQWVYGHSIATYAVSEGFGLTQIPSLRTAMDRAVQVIVDGQQSGGGWNYNYDNAPRRDTSVAGWQIQALKAASIANCEVPGLQAALDRSFEDLKGSQNAQGRFGYANTPGDGSIGLTGVGILCMQLLGYADTADCKSAIDYLIGRNLKLDWQDPTGYGDYPLYGWYYITQAKFHDGREFNDWNSQFAREFTRNQNEDGSWTPPGHEVNQGKVYGTTLAALTLQVYYRLLPTYQQQAVETRPVEAAPEEEEDLIEVT